MPGYDPLELGMPTLDVAHPVNIKTTALITINNLFIMIPFMQNCYTFEFLKGRIQT